MSWLLVFRRVGNKEEWREEQTGQLGNQLSDTPYYADSPKRHVPVVVEKTKRTTNSRKRPKRGRKTNTASLRQHGYATRTCPSGRHETGNTKQQQKEANKTENITTKNRLATHQDKQDISHNIRKNDVGYRRFYDLAYLVTWLSRRGGRTFNKRYVSEFIESRWLRNIRIRGSPVATDYNMPRSRTFELFSNKKKFIMLGMEPMHTMLRSGRSTHRAIVTLI